MSQNLKEFRVRITVEDNEADIEYSKKYKADNVSEAFKMGLDDLVPKGQVATEIKVYRID